LLRSLNKLLWPALFLALALASAAQQAGQPSPVEGRISGKVVDARSGAPLARCSVEISPTSNGGVTRSIDTGEDGLFLFDGLAQGKYSLSASKRGYLTQAYEEHDNYSTAIAVGPDLNSEELIFKVVPQAVISGVVTDDRGEPVRRAQVKLFKDDDRMGIRVTHQRQAVMTDDRGVYEIAQIDPGNYYLEVSARPWYAQPMRRPQANQSQEEEPDSPLDVAYATTFYPQVTDADEATPIPIKGGERFQADVTLTAQQSVHLRIPLPAAQPPGSFSLTISQSVFGQTEAANAPMQLIHDGVMEIAGLLPGHYDFVLDHLGGDSAAVPSTRFSADVTSGTTELTPAEAESDVTVTGKVTSTEGKLSDGGITLQATRPRRAYSARLDPKGEFAVKVPPGEYEIVGEIPQMYLARITAHDGELKNRVLTVKAGSSPELQLLAGKGFGQIDGVVKQGDQPVSGVMVLLAPDDNGFLFRRDQSDSDGTFTLENIVPGRYRLLAVERGWELEWANRDVLNAFLKKSVPVIVHANDKLTQAVEVQSQ
jgi:protocatechuate 3,4-dioxygenase beta subunit